MSGEQPGRYEQGGVASAPPGGRAGTREALLACVPVGRENAKAARAIYEAFGMWAYNSIKSQLKVLSDHGTIYRGMVERGSGNGQVSVYWREARRLETLK